MKQILTPAEAKAMLPNKSSIHTFRSSPGILLGCDWQKDELEKAIETHACELSGEHAEKMGHKLCINIDGHLFVETV